MSDLDWREALLDARAWRVRLDGATVEGWRLDEFLRWRASPINRMAWDVLASEIERGPKPAS